MAKKKLRVGVLFGGRSGEHEVSLLSAASVLQAIDRKRYEVVPIGITKQGSWLVGDEAQRLLAGGAAAEEQHADGGGELAGTEAAAGVPGAGSSGALAQVGGRAPFAGVDVVLPILHGTFGEDGTIQGLLELAGVAYAGSGVLGSALGMDKDAMKKMFAAAGLPVGKYATVLRGAWQAAPRTVIKGLEQRLKYPVFVKPANGGSSVGISKAHDREELRPALDLASRYDRKLVVEQAVGAGRKGHGKARELEVAVLGNDQPEASVVGEIVPGKEFYDYEAKYESQSSALILPAKLGRSEAKRLRAMAVEAFQACDCAGLARVDFLMDSDSGKVYLNEINTLPGFTAISMYPKLWTASGVEYPQLIDRLIELALERHAERATTSFTR